MLDITPTQRTAMGREHLSLVGRDGTAGQGLLLVLVGWLGVGVAYVVSALSLDPTSPGALLWAVGLSFGSLAAIGGGAAMAVAAARSPMRHVFHSRPLFRTAAVLLTFAVGALAVLVIRPPFDGIAAYGMPLAKVVLHFTLFASALICAIGGGAALLAAWRARRDERTWSRSLSGSSLGTRRSGS